MNWKSASKIRYINDGIYISVTYCKRSATPLLMDWSYVSFASTYWGRDKMVAISKRFSNAFSNFPLNNLPALVQMMAWRRSGDKPLSEPIMVNLLTHIYVRRPQCVKPSMYTFIVFRIIAWSVFHTCVSYIYIYIYIYIYYIYIYIYIHTGFWACAYHLRCVWTQSSDEVTNLF